MLYALLKTIHLLALIVWIGGMFFTLACLRPALGVLDAPARPRLMNAVMGRFFAIADAAIGLVLASGLGMLWLAGLGWRMPHAWYAMIVIGTVMMGIFGHIRGVLVKRLQRGLQAQDAPAIGAALARIRSAVLLNLGLGIAVVVVMKLGTAA